MGAQGSTTEPIGPYLSDANRLATVLTHVLLTDAKIGYGLPVPPLIKLISEYGLGFYDGGFVYTEIGMQQTPKHTPGTANTLGPNGTLVALGTARLNSPVTITRYPAGDRKGISSYLIGTNSSQLQHYVRPRGGGSGGYVLPIDINYTPQANLQIPIRIGRPYAVCVDPTNPNRLYCADQQCVWSILRRANKPQPSTDTILGFGEEPERWDATLLVPPPSSDQPAQMKYLRGAVCSGDGKTLWVVDSSNPVIFSVDTQTGSVEPVIGDGFNAQKMDAIASGVGLKCKLGLPQGLILDTYHSKATDAKPIVLVASLSGVLRVNLATREATVLPIDKRVKWCIYGVDILPNNGYLIINDIRVCSVFAVHPITGATTPIAGADGAGGGRVGCVDGASADAKFCNNFGLTLIPDEHAAIICDSANHVLRRVTLPPEVVDWQPPASR